MLASIFCRRKHHCDERSGWTGIRRGDETRQLVLSLGMVPVVPPKSNRIDPWRYDRTLYKKRNEIERLFRRIKGYRRIFSRFEKLDLIFLGFLSFAFIVEALR
jgi:transposase